MEVIMEAVGVYKTDVDDKSKARMIPVAIQTLPLASANPLNRGKLKVSPQA